MTVCNMSIEGGARAGLVAPDDTTFEYLHGRPHAPARAAVGRRGRALGALPTDDGATYDKPITIDADALEPMVTYGTNPGHGHPDHQPGPLPDDQADPGQRRALERALEYMDLHPARRSSARRSTSSSSAAARTAGSATCAWRPACSRTATSPTASG